MPVIVGADHDLITKINTQSTQLSSYAYLSTYGTLALAVSGIGANKRSLIIDEDDTVADDLTVPANIRLVPLPNCEITVANTKTLTINGSLEDTEHQVFVGPGCVAFGAKVKVVKVEWFGAVGDGSADDYAAINAAIVAVPSGGTVQLMPSAHKISQAITPPASKRFTLSGHRFLTSITGSGNHTLLDLWTNSVDYVTVQDIAFSGHATNQSDVVIAYALSTFIRCRFGGVNTTATTTAAMLLKAGGHSFYDCIFSGYGNGVIIKADANAIDFYSCHWSTTGTVVGTGGLVFPGGRTNEGDSRLVTIHGGSFEGNVRAIIVKKTWQLSVKGTNFENNEIDVSFQAASPADNYGSTPDGTILYDPDMVNLSFERCSFISEEACHFKFEGGVPNSLHVISNTMGQSNKAVDFSTSEPGEDFVWKDNYARDGQISAANCNITAQSKLANSVKRSWLCELDSYQVGHAGYATVGGTWPRPPFSGNVITAAPPTGWTDESAGVGAVFESSAGLTWFGANTLKIAKAAPTDTAKGHIHFTIPDADGYLARRWWTLSLLVRRPTTKQGRLKMSLDDGVAAAETETETCTYADRWYRAGFSFFVGGTMTGTHHDDTVLTLTLENDDPDAGDSILYVADVVLYCGIDERMARR